MFVIICTVNGLYMHAGGLLCAVCMLYDVVVAVVEEILALTFGATSQSRGVNNLRPVTSHRWKPQ